MKRIYYLPLAFFAIATFSCKEKSNTSDENVKKYDIANLDTTALPGTDFYQFATGGWAKANPMGPEYSSFGSFDDLDQKSRVQVQGLIEELGKTKHAQGSIEQKIGDLYAMAMDSVKLNTEGFKPIQSQLNKINAAANTTDIIKLVGEIAQYAHDPFFGIYVAADDKNSSMNLLNLYQSGLGLGNRDYYLDKDSTSVALLEGYKKLIKTQFVNIGNSEADAAKKADVILKIETAIAKAHSTKEDERIPEKNYNKMNVSDLEKKVGKFDWTTFFDAAKAKGFTELNVAQPKAIAEAIKLIQTTPLDDSKAYLSWCVMNASSSCLSDKMYDASFDFYGKQLSGRLVQQPRWKRSVGAVSGALSEAVGQMYVAKFFPPEAKNKMLTLVKNLQGSFGDRIKNLTWMDEATKTKALDKLNTITIKIGYPDEWKDYSTLDIQNDNYWANVVRAKQFSYNEMINKIGKPVDKAEWLMSPQMVNAYYNPSSNEICFPAGILQPPFFYMDGDDAVNYGAIGVVIAHEMTHGFDDQGSKYDKEGNLSVWWAPNDITSFNAKTKVLVDHFNNIEVLPGVKANGVYTLGENIADFGGVQIAYTGFAKTEEATKAAKIDGYTPQQRFFLSYGRVWAGHIRDEEALRLTKVDVHSLAKWRVNGTLPHIDAWYEAFNITDKDPMYIAKDKRADIW